MGLCQGKEQKERSKEAKWKTWMQNSRPRLKEERRQWLYTCQSLKKMAQCRTAWRNWCLNLPLGGELKETEEVLTMMKR